MCPLPWECRWTTGRWRQRGRRCAREATFWCRQTNEEAWTPMRERRTWRGRWRFRGIWANRGGFSCAEVDLGLDWTTAHAGSFSARLYGSTEIYHQSFSAVATDRNSETLTDLQRNP